MPLPGDYWTAYERACPTLGEFLGVVESLSETWPERKFVWRGVGDASYALHSSLYRRASADHGSLLREGGGPGATLRVYEERIVREAQEWALQRTATDWLSALELLAALQHQGVPTRLLDFSHNAFVALWFAVEQKYDANGNPRPDQDGRVFIAEATGREVDPNWGRMAELPWMEPAGTPADWRLDVFVWTPPPIDARMTSQQGCFVFGGVPSTEGGWNLRGHGMMTRDQIRSCVSIPIRLNNPQYIDRAVLPGRPPGYPFAFTLRIPADSKQRIRRDLARGFGYTHAMMYPDLPGFATFGRSFPPAG